jgi:peptidyl-tRNA hydrolase, PTH1 family
MRWLRRSHVEDDDRWLVAGLGNPGERYATTRHNVGILVLDVLLRRTGASLRRHKSGCLIAEEALAGRKVILTRTLSYMNESGRPLRDLARFYKIPVEAMIVVHDELDIPFGSVRVKVDGGTAGHNGLRSLESHFRSRDYTRVRVGIGRPSGRSDATGHVLDAFSSSERRVLEDVLERAADAVERILEIGPDRAMNEVNTLR